VPKLTVICRKSYGGAYCVMNPRHLGADLVFAWPSAEIAVMGPPRAVDTLFADQIKAAPDPAAARQALIAEYARDHASAYQAAQRGFIDEVIDPGETRPKIIRALRFLRGKQPDRIAKKHGNMPF
ncbi:MAG: carboxyl transferase domain-containing protein, partial [Elusimicrobiota bacterium]|jgi:acetyl-CoA carboxylase carboxyltransferase component